MWIERAPFFSIIMPVYNRAELIRESIESVLMQSFVNFELICVDDGSTDNTHDVLLEMAAKDLRIKIVSHENKGRCQARNSGIKAAKGEWIAFLDSDDYYLENHLSTLYQLIQKFPGFSGIASELVYKDRIRDYTNCNYYRDYLVVSLDDFAVANPISLNQFCYRKKDYPDLLFPEINILAAEDLLFFRMFSHRYKILKSGIITNYVNTHQNRSVNLISPDQFVYWNTFATQYFIENFKLPSNVVRKMKQYLHLFVSNIHLSSGNRKQGFKEMLKVLRYPSTYFNILFYKAVAKLLIH